MISLERYAELFRVPGMAAAVTASVVGRIPIGMAGLSILLFVQGKSGSFAQAGTVSALYVLGLAVVAPFLGRLIDRTGPRVVLTLCSHFVSAGFTGAGGAGVNMLRIHCG